MAVLSASGYSFFVDAAGLPTDLPPKPTAPLDAGQRLWVRDAGLALLIFILSRLLVVTAAFLAPLLIQGSTRPGQWNVPNPWLRPLFRWDAGWYLSICQEGYLYDGDPTRAQNLGFFPLYPMSCSVLHRLTGWSIEVSAVVLSNTAFLGAMVALHALARREIGRRAADGTVILLAFFPASLFFSTMYTESFYLLFSVLALSAFRRDRLVTGGIWTALASATRVVGLFLLIPMAYEVLSRRQLVVRRTAVIAAVALAVTGVAVFCAWQWWTFGDPLAHFRVQRQAPLWRGHFKIPLPNLEWSIRQGFKGRFAPSPFDAWFSILLIVLAVRFWRRLSPGWSVYTLLCILLPLCTRSGTVSMTRYVVVLFPAFMALGLLSESHRWMRWFLPGFFALCLGVFTMHFAQWHWVG